MPTATKKTTRRKPTLHALRRELSGLRSRVEELEDLRDLKAAATRNQGKPGVPWSRAKTHLGLA